MKQQKLHNKIEKWVKNLKSGDGDYKKIYTENLLELYMIVDCANLMETSLYNDLKEMVEKILSHDYDRLGCHEKDCEKCNLLKELNL